MRMEQAVLEQTYRDMLSLTEENAAPGIEFARERHPETLMAYLHPVTFLWTVEPSLRCPRMQLEGVDLRTTLGFAVSAEELERHFDDRFGGEGRTVAPDAEDMARTTFEILGNMEVPVTFDAGTGILRSATFEAEWETPLPGQTEPTPLHFVWSLELQDVEFVAAEEEVLALPDDLEPTDVTQLAQMFIRMAKYQAGLGAGDADLED